MTEKNSAIDDEIADCLEGKKAPEPLVGDLGCACYSSLPENEAHCQGHDFIIGDCLSQ